mmetsp:Transcript_40099/g.85373  ORF Transcript_40099/g.85373 Transcript_40099/m.85373 type:complete len:203 (-) Transcript_40099:269-877(-)
MYDGEGYEDTISLRKHSSNMNRFSIKEFIHGEIIILIIIIPPARLIHWNVRGARLAQAVRELPLRRETVRRYQHAHYLPFLAGRVILPGRSTYNALRGPRAIRKSVRRVIGRRSMVVPPMDARGKHNGLGGGHSHVQVLHRRGRGMAVVVVGLRDADLRALSRVIAMIVVVHVHLFRNRGHLLSFSSVRRIRRRQRCWSRIT